MIFQTMASFKYIYSKPWPTSNIYIPNHGLLQIYIYSKPWPTSNIYIPNNGLLKIYIYSKPWPP